MTCRLSAPSHYYNQWWHSVDGPVATNFSEICIEIQQFSFKEMHLKMSSGNWRQFSLRLNVFRRRHFWVHFLEQNAWISLKFSLKFLSRVPVNNIPALVQVMAWCRLGDKSLSEPMIVGLLTHICVTRPQWTKFSCVSLFAVNRRVDEYK